jgi:hypothetical protein
MTYGIEMGSVAMIYCMYIPNLIKIGSGNQNLTRKIHRHIDTQIHRQHRDSIILHPFSQNRESKLKN